MLVDEDRADHIDLNFGCPVPKVTRKGGGAALPWKLGLFRDIVERAATAAGDVPLTVKMRKGIDADHLTYLEAGRIAEDAGVAAVALHARTAAEFYSRHGRLVGDRRRSSRPSRACPCSATATSGRPRTPLRMMAETGCDGVVVGRGCLGRPWLFGDLAAGVQRRAADGRADARRRRAGLPPSRRAARRVLRGRGPRLPRHPQARRLVLQGLPGRRRDARGARDGSSSLAEIDELLATARRRRSRTRAPTPKGSAAAPAPRSARAARRLARLPRAAETHRAARRGGTRPQWRLTARSLPPTATSRDDADALAAARRTPPAAATSRATAAGCCTRRAAPPRREDAGAEPAQGPTSRATA